MTVLQIQRPNRPDDMTHRIFCCAVHRHKIAHSLLHFNQLTDLSISDWRMTSFSSVASSLFTTLSVVLSLTPFFESTQRTSSSNEAPSSRRREIPTAAVVGCLRPIPRDVASNGSVSTVDWHLMTGGLSAAGTASCSKAALSWLKRANDMWRRYNKRLVKHFTLRGETTGLVTSWRTGMNECTSDEPPCTATDRSM